MPKKKFGDIYRASADDKKKRHQLPRKSELTKINQELRAFTDNLSRTFNALSSAKMPHKKLSHQGNCVFRIGSEYTDDVIGFDNSEIKKGVQPKHLEGMSGFKKLKSLCKKEDVCLNVVFQGYAKRTSSIKITVDPSHSYARSKTYDYRYSFADI